MELHGHSEPTSRLWQGKGLPVLACFSVGCQNTAICKLV